MREISGVLSPPVILLIHVAVPSLRTFGLSSRIQSVPLLSSVVGRLKKVPEGRVAVEVSSYDCRYLNMVVVVVYLEQVHMLSGLKDIG